MKDNKKGMQEKDSRSSDKKQVSSGKEDAKSVSAKGNRKDEDEKASGRNTGSGNSHRGNSM